jgi:peptide/nickel transport system permease protein
MAETVAAGAIVKRSRIERTAALVRDICGRPSGLAGLVIVSIHVVVAVLSPWIVPYDYMAQDPELILGPPSAEHWLGADQFGRDILTRTLLGGREALLVTFAATLIALAAGSLVGIAVGYVGGKVDEIAMRVVDAFLAVPWLLFVLLIASVVGTEGAILIPTLAFFYGLPIIRVARGATLDIVARDFVSAARARGERKRTIILRELLPNIHDVLLVEGAMEWSWMLLAFSSLSFLGCGVAPPQPDWGLMIADARLYLPVAPMAAIAPMVALGSLIIGINLAADALGKALGVDRGARGPV